MVTLLQTNGSPSRSFAPLTRWWPWTSGEWTGPLFSAAKKGFVIRESEVAMGKWPISGWFAQRTKPPEILHGQVWLPEGSTGRILSSKIGLLPKALISAANIEHLTNKKLGYLNRNYGRYHHILHIYIIINISIYHISPTLIQYPISQRRWIVDGDVLIPGNSTDNVWRFLIFTTFRSGMFQWFGMHRINCPTLLCHLWCDSPIFAMTEHPKHSSFIIPSISWLAPTRGRW